jgi:hypothetical protein
MLRIPDINWQPLLIGITATLWFSCEEEQRLTFSGRDYVRFTELEGRVLENEYAPTEANLNQPVEVSIHLVGPQRNEPVTVTYESVGTATLGEDFEILTDNIGEATIPAGESFTSFKFRPINNRENEGNRTAIFRLSSAGEGVGVGVYDQAVLGRFARYTIRDDDCLQDLRLFSGTWTVEERIAENTEDSTSVAQEYEIQIEPDFTVNNRLVIRGFGGLTEQNGEVFANVDLCNNEIFVPEQEVTADSGNPGNARTVANGTFNIQDGGTISFRYSLDGFGSSEFLVRATKNDD